MVFPHEARRCWDLRFGFQPAGIRKNYYAETNEDALVMWVDDIDTDDYAARLDALEARLESTVGRDRRR